MQSLSLIKPFCDVHAFHTAFGHPAPDVPTPLTAERCSTRAGWVRDECDELEDDTAEVLVGVSEGKQDEADLIAVQVDASLDQIYFGFGNLVELGLDPSPLWDIVQHANMSKLHNIDGVMTAVKTGAGKVVKPEGWQDPHPLLVAEVRRQITIAKYFANEREPGA